MEKIFEKSSFPFVEKLGHYLTLGDVENLREVNFYFRSWII